MTDMLFRDLSSAIRHARKRPFASSVMIAVLALAIGVNASVFAVAKAVLFDALPVKDPEGLVLLRWTSGPQPAVGYMTGEFSRDAGSGRIAAASFPYPAYQALRQHTQTWSALVASSSLGEVSVSFDGTASLGRLQVVSANFFDDLGVRATMGRLLGPGDDHAASDAVVITFEHWRTHFGGNRDVIGKPGYLENRPARIVGVIERRFSGTLQIGSQAEFFAPIAAITSLRPKAPYLSSPDWFWLQLLGRLQPGVTEERALAELDPVFGATLPPSEDQPRLALASGSQGYANTRNAQREPLVILSAVCLLLFAMGCVSVASSLAGRASERAEELAIRRSLGARRFDLARHLTVDCLFYALSGGALSLVLAYWTRNAIVATLMPALAVTADIDAGVVMAVVAATALVAAVTAVPLLIGLWRQPYGVPAGSRISAAAGFRAVLVLQIAMAVVPLVAAGLLTRTYRNLREIDTGMVEDSIIAFKVRAAPDANTTATLAKQLREQLAQLPVVSRVGLSSRHMLGDNSDRVAVTIAGADGGAGIPEYALVNRVAGDFFEVMGIRATEGRLLDRRDEDHAEPICVVNEAFRSKHFGDSSAIGRTVNNRTIVGVAADTAYGRLRDGALPMIFTPLFQQPVNALAFQVETAANHAVFQPLARRALQSVDPMAVAHGFRTIHEQILADTARERWLAGIATLVSTVTLAMIALSLWGATVSTIDSRTREMAVRLALGADAKMLVSAVARTNLVLAGIGIAVGLTAAVFAGRLASSTLYDIAPVDAINLLSAGAIAGLLAGTACLWPARRVLKISPSAALRPE